MQRLLTSFNRTTSLLHISLRASTSPRLAHSIRTMASFPVSFPADKPVLRLDRLQTSPSIYVLHMLSAETPDNRLTVHFLEQWMEALNFVEKEWDQSDEQKAGAALISTGPTDPKAKFYSNGLDFEKVLQDPEFFDKHLNRVYEKLLSFPIPTVAAIGGHCFAAGFGLVMSHDYRVQNGQKGFLCMNEIDFGAQIPPGLYAALNSKNLPSNVMRKMVLEGHRFGAKEAQAERIIDIISPSADEKVESAPAKTLETAIEVAKSFAKKAGADAYQSNKLVIYAPYLATLRERNEDATARL
jgi:Delta3-Delta2-enoyl-CoA isomerase